MGVPRAHGSEPGPWGLGAHVVHCTALFCWEEAKEKKKEKHQKKQKTQTHIVLAFLVSSVVAVVAVYMKRGVWGSFLVGGRTACLWGCRHAADSCEQTCYHSMWSCHFCGHFCLFTWYVIWGGRNKPHCFISETEFAGKKKRSVIWYKQEWTKPFLIMTSLVWGLRTSKEEWAVLF